MSDLFIIYSNLLCDYMYLYVVVCSTTLYSSSSSIRTYANTAPSSSSTIRIVSSM